MKKSFGMPLLLLASIMVIGSCGNRTSNFVSSKTGWNYNDKNYGGFEVPSYEGQYVGPGLSFVEGGTFTMGQTEEDLMYDNSNVPHRVTVSSFYMDETEVANVHWKEYEYWTKRVYGNDYPEVWGSVLPDTMCWRKAMQYNEPLVELYYRHAAYNMFPVVGISWEQANRYCEWRTDRVNELILMQKGYLKKNPYQVADDNFVTSTYVAGQYEGLAGKKKKDIDPTGSGDRNIGYADGILIAPYRLPTEAEWEYAALGYIGQNPEPDTKRRRGEEIVLNRQVYPWGDNLSTRSGERDYYQGEELGNFSRGMGDKMGTAGALNDNADIPGPVYGFKPNSFGLYHMAGNVSEWVKDVYRPNTPMDGSEFRTFRGNIFDKYKILDDLTLDEKDSLGRLVKVPIDSTDMAGKYIDYTQANNIGYIDGDSSIRAIYDYGKSTLISNDAHVYKGGSWDDRAYWMSPGTRRFLQANQTSSRVGFRCCMDRLGSPTLHTPGGNYFGLFGKGIRK